MRFFAKRLKWATRCGSCWDMHYRTSCMRSRTACSICFHFVRKSSSFAWATCETLSCASRCDVRVCFLFHHLLCILHSRAFALHCRLGLNHLSCESCLPKRSVFVITWDCNINVCSCCANDDSDKRSSLVAIRFLRRKLELYLQTLLPSHFGLRSRRARCSKHFI